MTARAYYNEINPDACEWLRLLIAAGHIAAGDVDGRSIVDVEAADLKGYTQAHFFAGIGGWSLALRLAGWPDHRPVWTGSCPCQPLSSAGKHLGHADERHLWPAFYHLIAECRPATVFGEQVAGKDGREWLAAVRSDLEGCGYACGAADLAAAGVGAPHKRQRLFWLADDQGIGRSERQSDAGGGLARIREGRSVGHRIGSAAGELADADDARPQGRDREHADQSGWQEEARHPRPCCDAGGLADGEDDGTGPTNGLWRDADWLFCRDGKWRPVESGTFPLAHGVSARVGRLRGYGNAIVPQAAAEVIGAYMELGA